MSFALQIDSLYGDVVTLAHFKTLGFRVAALRKDFMLVLVHDCLANTRLDNVASLEGLVPVDQNMA